MRTRAEHSTLLSHTVIRTPQVAWSGERERSSALQVWTHNGDIIATESATTSGDVVVTVTPSRPGSPQPVTRVLEERGSVTVCVMA